MLVCYMKNGFLIGYFISRGFCHTNTPFSNCHTNTPFSKQSKIYVQEIQAVFCYLSAVDSRDSDKILPSRIKIDKSMKI